MKYHIVRVEWSFDPMLIYYFTDKNPTYGDRWAFDKKDAFAFDSKGAAKNHVEYIAGDEPEYYYDSKWASRHFFSKKEADKYMKKLVAKPLLWKFYPKKSLYGCYASSDYCSLYLFPTNMDKGKIEDAVYSLRRKGRGY